MYFLNEKFCPKCKKVKPANEFGKDSQHSDGLQSYCRPCMNAYILQYKKVRAQELFEAYMRELGEMED